MCEEGFYSYKDGLVVCEPCQNGNYCQNLPNPLDAVKPCIKGSVCVTGVARQPNCPDGLYLNDGACRTCTGGRYCRGGQIAGFCAAGYTCNGTAVSDPNPSGYECPAGMYCGMGVTTPTTCPFKTMSVADKQRKATDCRGCQPGYVCEWGVRDWFACPPGSWCPVVGDMRVYNKYEYKCPPGTFNPDKLKIY